MRDKGRFGIDVEKERRQMRQKRPGCVALLRIFQSLHLLLLKPDHNVPKVPGVVGPRPRTESRPHSLQGFFSDASCIKLDAVQEFYSTEFREGSGGGVWVRMVIGIDSGEGFDLP